MINTTYFLALTQAIEESSKSAPLERWLDRAKELQNEMSWRVVALSRYMEELPESSYACYADALASALQGSELSMKIEEVCDLKNNLDEFAKRLEDHGFTDKAVLLREAIQRECQPKK